MAGGSSTGAYSDGMIQVPCRKCGAEIYSRCKYPGGLGSVRTVKPHSVRIKDAKEKREREQR